MSWPLPFFIFYFGAIVGSFLNMLIHRLPLELSIIRPRSFCPSCQKTIPWYCNFPLFSYLILKGKCFYCKSTIPVRYLLVEILASTISLLLFLLFLQYPPSPFMNLNSLATLFLFWGMSFFVSCLLLAHFFIDLKHQILPDSLNILLALCLFFISFLSQAPWPSVFLGGAIGLLFPLAITWAYYLIRGQVGLGGGDIKMWGAMGLFLGPFHIFENIFASCMLGSLFALSLIFLNKLKKEDPIPFGPFIIIVFFFQFLSKLFPQSLFHFSLF